MTSFQSIQKEGHNPQWALCFATTEKSMIFYSEKENSPVAMMSILFIAKIPTNLIWNKGKWARNKRGIPTRRTRRSTSTYVVRMSQPSEPRKPRAHYFNHTSTRSTQYPHKVRTKWTDHLLRNYSQAPSARSLCLAYSPARLLPLASGQLDLSWRFVILGWV